MASQWFYARGGQKCGPVTSAELKAMARNGQLVASDLIWKEGMKEWVLAASSAQLFPDDIGTGTFHFSPPSPSGNVGELKGITEILGLDPAPSSGVDPLLGQVLGDVTLVRAIAEGGMGRVYEGLQDKPRRPVAVKVMRPGFVSQEVCRRFDNEAEVLGRLRHPYIAQIYSAGICTIVGAQVPFFVMEYVADALPLTAYAKQNSLSTQHRLELFRKVCEAVAHGHEKGVIHRDLKPSNILVEPGGLPKVIDFGIARCVDATPEQMTALTDIGKLIGTVQYMSPEQFSGDSTQIDQRSDVYALGVILYELLAGRPPYEISQKQIFEAAQVVRKHRPAPPSRFNKELSSQVVKLIEKCLQKQRVKRYGTAGDLASAIDDSLAVSSPSGMISPAAQKGGDVDKQVPRRLSPIRAALNMAGLSLLGWLLFALLATRFAPSPDTLPWPPGITEDSVRSSEFAASYYCDTTKTLSPDMAKSLSQQLSGKRIEFGQLETLTPAAAVSLPPCRELTFAALTSISDDTAEALASGSGALSMPALLSISATAGSALTKRIGGLGLDGLTSLSEELAKAISKCSGDLTLNGIRDLPIDVAGALATHKHNLRLNGLQDISAPSAEALSQHQALSSDRFPLVNTISLNGLACLDTSSAKGLARFEGNLELNSLTVMTPDLAGAFSEHPGSLSLDGLRLLPEETAEALVRHDGDLSLGGLKTLRPEVAKILALHRHELALNDIEWISVETARALSKRQGKGINLWGLKRMTESELMVIKELLPNASFPSDLKPFVPNSLSTEP
jgi:serine/threonine protein kinase